MSIETYADLDIRAPIEQPSPEDILEGARDRAVELWGADVASQMDTEEMLEELREHDYWTFVR